jgi:hypothetical protein
MKRKFVPVALAAVMAFNMAACSSGDGDAATPTPAGDATPTPNASSDPVDPDDGGEPEEDVEPYTVRTKADGSPIDLGGMEIVIRDWFSTDETDIMQADPDSLSSYEAEIREYREWAMEKYNFKMSQGIVDNCDWGNAPQQFVDYVTTGGDDNAYIFTVRDCNEMTAAMRNGQMYDLSTLDCLDFSDHKYQQNLLHEQYSYNGGIYAFYGSIAEPRDGVYFNKKLLEDGGHTADEIYDLQKNGQWTWDAFEQICKDVQKDTDNDGTVDVAGWTANTGGAVEAFIYSNGGEIVGKDASGKYTLKVNEQPCVDALEFANRMIKEYRHKDPQVQGEDGTMQDAPWDYYKDSWKNGDAVFLLEQEYAGTPGNFLADISFDAGFVMMPYGPDKADKQCVNRWSNNPALIPGCYDAEKAWNIAFAYDVWFEVPPEIEEENSIVSRARSGIFDQRALDETLPMMSDPAHGCISFAGMIPDLQTGPDLIWGINGDAKVSEAVDAVVESWQAKIDAANN